MLRHVLRSRRVAALAAVFILTIGAAPRPDSETIEDARYIAARPLKGDLFHVQGLAPDGDRLFVTSVDRAARRGYLHEFDRHTGSLRRRLEVTDGPRYHPGGISISGRSIWVPVAEMRPGSSARLLEVDADSLAVHRRIAVADHLGCVAALGDILVAGNWHSRRLYVFDLATGARRVVANRSGTAYQDMKFADGKIVAGGTRTPWSGTVDWLDWRPCG